MFEDDEQQNALGEAQHVANDDAAAGNQLGKQPDPQLAQPSGGDRDSSSRSGNVVSISISDEGSIGATLEQMKGNLAMIKAVDPKSNAEKAGLMAGDLPLLLGQRALYGEFIEACKTRPLVFQVLREIIAIKSGDEENAIASDDASMNDVRQSNADAIALVRLYQRAVVVCPDGELLLTDFCTDAVRKLVIEGEKASSIDYEETSSDEESIVEASTKKRKKKRRPRKKRSKVRLHASKNPLISSDCSRTTPFVNSAPNPRRARRASSFLLMWRRGRMNKAQGSLV